MAWDDTKGDGSTLTPDEWNTHVTDQKTRTVSGAIVNADINAAAAIAVTKLSGVPFNTVTSPARALDTVYQNTTGFMMAVIVIINYSGAGVQIRTDAANPPTTVVGEISASLDKRNTCTFFVQSGHYYLMANLGTSSIVAIKEYTNV